MFRSEDCGLFIGLTTMPFGYEKDFYQQEIKHGIFQAYRERLQRYMLKEEETISDVEFEKYFYQPKAYRLFGNFDLAVISLVDDFSLSSRVFHPFSSLINDHGETNNHYYSNSFNYQTITGLVPTLEDPDENPQAYLVEKAKATFLASICQRDRPATAFPLLGICSLKLNNELLIGTGTEYSLLCIRALDQLLSKSEACQNGELNFIFIHSFSWNEFTVLFFSDNYQKISEQILRISELRVKDLSPFQAGNELESITADCLSAQFNPTTDLNDTPVFASVFTTLGYDHDYLAHPEYFDHPPSYLKPWDDTNNSALRLYQRWNIRPGHLDACLPLIEGAEALTVIAGRSDLVYRSETDSMKTLVKKVNAIIADSEKQVHQFVRDIYSVVEYTPATIPSSKGKHSQKSASQNFPSRRFTFPIEEINQLRSDLKSCRISKILLDKIINMFVSYNDGIQDAVLYIYYIELWSYLERVRRLARYYSDYCQTNVKSVRDLSKNFQDLCTDYEKAHRNRFHQSYIMNEITDYNIEFNGGIQQLTGAYDMAYKSMLSLFGGQENQMPVAYVSSYSGVSSDLFTVKLNYYHLFHPEFFLAVATHEAVNFYLQNIESQSGRLDAYIDLDKKLRDPDFCNKADIPSAVWYYQVDIVTFYVGYNCDAELFAYWHLGIFLSTPLYYNTDGSLNENLFMQLLLRVLLLFRSRGVEDVLSAKEAPTPSLAGFWKKYYQQLSDLADDLLARPDLKVWFDYSREFARTKVIDDFTGFKEEREMNAALLAKIQPQMDEHLFQQQRVKNKERFLNLYDKEDDREIMLVLGRFQEMQHLSDAMITSFEKGEVFHYPGVHVVPTTTFKIHSLFYAYLRLLMQMNKGELFVLERGKDGRPAPDKNQQEGLIFDSIGGIFTRNTKTRRQYFQYRSLLIASLIQIGNKEKLRLFESFDRRKEE